MTKPIIGDWNIPDGTKAKATSLAKMTLHHDTIYRFSTHQHR